MNIREAIKARHSVRQFTDKPLGEAEAARLREIIGSGGGISRPRRRG